MNIQNLADDKTYILISTNQHVYGDLKRWWGKMSKEIDGVKVEIEEQADTLDELADVLTKKWDRVTGSITEFAGSLITYERANSFHEDLADEIPF